jgi:hypothetical protein
VHPAEVTQPFIDSGWRLFQAHEDESVPLDQGELVQPVIAAIKPIGSLHAGRTEETTVQGVRPEVEWAAHPGAVALTDHHLSGPVAAGVGEGPQLILTPDDHHRYTTYVNGAEIADFGPPVETTHADPTTPEHGVAFNLMDIGVGVAGSGQGGCGGRWQQTGRKILSQPRRQPGGANSRVAHPLQRTS